MFPFKKILWAVDPYAEDAQLQTRLVDTLNAMAGDHGAPIEPVSLLAHGDEGMVSKVKESVSAYAKKVGLKGVTGPTVLVQPDTSLGNAVRSLIDYARKDGASLIAVGSQARKGATRFLLGSFAETLVLQSDVPTLVVSPQTHDVKKIRRILFPTDITGKSKSVFPQVVAFAKQIGAEVVVFHRQGPESFGREKELEQLVEVARQGGAHASLLFEQGGLSTTQEIIALSEQSGTILAMVSQTNSLGSLILGSVTRQVLRHAECPVWVIHPKK